ncbi:isoprenylcysteine carboxylmethyltransferase family protein [Methanoregula sp.]|uniref:methyltransferase family protein n=1 Tax=Methanoregula sp. TaxID=2052170 RepID=UPI003565BD80
MAAGLRETARAITDGQGYFLVLLILSIVSHFIFPVRILLQAPVTWSGFLIIGAGIWMAFRCRVLFLQNRTTLSPYESPAVLITTGPFRISRNPVYLAMAAVLFGSAVVMGTLVPFVFTFLFIVIVEMLFIPFEERRLEEIFGDEYRDYKRRVRQWV